MSDIVCLQMYCSDEERDTEINEEVRRQVRKHTKYSEGPGSVSTGLVLLYITSF